MSWINCLSIWKKTRKLANHCSRGFKVLDFMFLSMRYFTFLFVCDMSRNEDPFVYQLSQHIKHDFIFHTEWVGHYLNFSFIGLFVYPDINIKLSSITVALYKSCNQGLLVLQNCSSFSGSFLLF